MRRFPRDLVKQNATFAALAPIVEVLDTIDLCIDELRNATGFWKGKGMSIAATQVGKPNMPVFLICARENWYTSR